MDWVGPLPQPTLSKALSLWQWGVGRGANQWREGWWSFPPEWYGVFVGDLKWVKTGVIFWGAGL